MCLLACFLCWFPTWHFVNPLQQAITSGYYYHTSVLSKGGYKTVKHQQVYTCVCTATASLKALKCIILGTIIHTCTLPCIAIIGECERANLVVRLARFFAIYIYVSSIAFAYPVYKLQDFICNTRGPTRNNTKNAKLYVYFKNTSSFRISGIYRYM